MRTGWRDDRLLVPIGFLGIVIVAYHFVFGAFFLSDDFAFLNAAKTGEWLWPREMYGSFFRPVTLLSFRLTYLIWGLDPRPYHLVNVFLHTINAVLVYGLARVMSQRAWPSAAAGAVFLVFAGHAEAVSWISGRADVLSTTGVLVGLLCAARALKGVPGTAGWLSGWPAAFVAFSLALLSKESAIVIPALVALLVAVVPGAAAWRTRAGVVAGCAALAAGALVARRLLLGVAFGEYGSFGIRHMLDAPGLFLYKTLLPAAPFRVFEPPGPIGVGVYIGLVAVAILLAVRRRDLTALFAAGAVVVALLPVLSLSISLNDIQSERLIYLPSAFGATLLAFVVIGAAESVRARPLAYVLLAAFCAVNLRTLRLTNTRFADAGGLTKSLLASLGTEIARAKPDAKVFILNLPDTHYGIYVFRGGLNQALALFHPELFTGNRFVLEVAREVTLSPTQTAAVTSTGPSTFHVTTVGPLVTPPVSSAFTTIEHPSWYGFDVTFHGIEDGLVLYVSGGRALPAGTIHGVGAPFGVIDTPRIQGECSAPGLRVAGWVLFSGPGGRVSVSRDGPASTSGEALLGGPRDDIQTLFPGFRDAGRSGWEYTLECASLPPGSTMIRVTATDANGSTELGAVPIRRGPARPER